MACPGVGHRLRNRERVHAVVAQLIDFLEADVFRALPAHARPGDDRRALPQLRRPFDPRALHRLARRDHFELREAVHEIRAPVLKLRRVTVAAYLGAILKPQLRAIRGFNPADSQTALAQRRCHFRNGPAERADRAHPGNRDATHRYWLADAPAALAATSFSTPSAIWRTLRTLRTSSSGIEISNSFSRAKRISTASIESIPNCWNSLSIVTCSRGIRLEVAMLLRTRCVSSSDISVGLWFRT